MNAPWSHVIKLGAVRAPMKVHLEADGAVRGRIARLLDLASLESLTADLTIAPWYDGVEVHGSWSAALVQTCGVTLEPLPSAPSGTFTIRAVPMGSLHAPSESTEISVELEAEDPPDVLEDDDIDLAGYVVEHLALEIDPFPRKEGAQFEPPADNAELSPFAVLRKLQPPQG